MKKQSLWSKIGSILLIAKAYSRQHADSLAALEKVYIKRRPREDCREETVSTLSISRFGSVFKVHQKSYLYDDLVKEETWMATYGWQSSGHLIEIGGDRYLIFDPLHKVAYLEDSSDLKSTTLNFYNQI
ncbi:hypothetical protein FMM05_10300 [Flavobacterium zepuense]|uniref:Uncharacterized protein n=1 Tax=Flavobacterium zepuense TaxID=2593302 RepID=A0A552V165_9FLAO|nr:hypothetical protein [Flavobacterium zepuense]TRW24218.1 hypothetical protein FMM05_10300 [Flavobacterium zepuense]